MQLEFNADIHQYKLNGTVLPAVSHVLEPLKDFTGIPAEALKHKRALAIELKKAVEKYIFGDLSLLDISAELTPYFNGFLEFMDDTGFTVNKINERVYSKLYGYAGTLDLIGELNGNKVLVNTRIANTLDKSVGAQLEAYKIAYNDLNPKAKIKKTFALQFKQDGSYRLIEYKNKLDFEMFKSCLNIYNYKKH